MTPRTLAAPVLLGFVLLALGQRGEAHKPITSPYMYETDVQPILQAHCGACHMDGGIAPMSLLEYQASVPWAESMRLELISGHMPPWGVTSGRSRFRNVRPLTSHELNVLLTWAAGGTPRGEPTEAPAPSGQPSWRLGPPDLVLEPATAFTLGADVREHVETFSLELPAGTPRWVRAVDLLPGAPAVVRRAEVIVQSEATDRGRRAGFAPEQRLALWLPGDTPVALEDGAGFLLPAGARLTLRVHYRKTWLNERDVVQDRSRVGLYFAEDAAADVRAIELAPSAADLAAAQTASTVTFSRSLAESVDVLAIYPGPALHDAGVEVSAIRLDGTRQELIAFRPLPDWTRRYWYREPVPLPAGTRIEVRVVTRGPASLLAPPGVPPRAPMNPADATLTLNVVRTR